MDKSLQLESSTDQEECTVTETRQYACLVKLEKIVNQFEELMEMVDSVTKSRKKRRTVLNPQRKKSTSSASGDASASAGSGAAAVNSAATIGLMNPPRAEVGEGSSSTVSLASQADKTAALENILTKHLTELQSDLLLDFHSNQ